MKYEVLRELSMEIITEMKITYRSKASDKFHVKYKSSVLWDITQ
jgi:hypothetical protein